MPPIVRRGTRWRRPESRRPLAVVCCTTRQMVHLHSLHPAPHPAPTPSTPLHPPAPPGPRPPKSGVRAPAESSGRGRRARPALPVSQLVSHFTYRRSPLLTLQQGNHHPVTPCHPAVTPGTSRHPLGPLKPPGGTGCRHRSTGPSVVKLSDCDGRCGPVGGDLSPVRAGSRACHLEGSHRGA